MNDGELRNRFHIFKKVKGTKSWCIHDRLTKRNYPFGSFETCLWVVTQGELDINLFIYSK